jgi:hypothetical protein
MRRLTALALATSVAVAGSVGLAASASAKGDDVRQRDTCSASSTWAAKIKSKHSGLRVDYWVKTQQTGQSWTATIKQNGTTVLTSTKNTRAHDNQGQDDTGHVAEAKWRVSAQDAAGADTFVLSAVNAASGETCTVTLTR